MHSTVMNARKMAKLYHRSVDSIPYLLIQSNIPGKPPTVRKAREIISNSSFNMAAKVEQDCTEEGVT